VAFFIGKNMEIQLANFIVSKGKHPVNSQIIFKFPNNYGASVVLGPHTYGGSDGLFELAVVEFDPMTNEYSICYNTPITDDVLGCLMYDEVLEYLYKIKNLTRGINDERE
jgi:hypothetical protein